MKRLHFFLIMLVILILSAGCVRGEIGLEIGRLGSADVNAKVLVMPILKDALNPIKDKFSQDNFTVMDIREGKLEGFQASRKFAKLSQLKDIAVFKGMGLQKPGGKPGEPAPAPGKQILKEPKFIVEKGLFFDKYKIDADLDLTFKQDNMSGKEDNLLVRNLMSQVDLRFVAKLPTKTDRNNANHVSSDGQTLTWNLQLGEHNQIVAEATMLNYVNAGILLVVILLVLLVGGYMYRRRQS